MNAFGAYIPVDRRHALVSGQALPELSSGAVLITDISGFTRLTETLTTALGFQRGAEELGQHLNRLYGILIDKVHRYHGSVVQSGGDALISWFDGDEKTASRRAVSAAFSMQYSMDGNSAVSLPDRETVQLAIRSAVACGSVRRFLAGDPEVRLFEALAGSPARPGGCGGEPCPPGRDRCDGERRQSAERGGGDPGTTTGWRWFVRFCAGQGKPFERSHAMGYLARAGQGTSQPWLHSFLYEHIIRGQEGFMAQLRPAVSMFTHFDGIDYDVDPQAGGKLDALIRLVQKNAGRYGGTLIDITTGDKGSYFYIAVGAPYAHEDDAARAVGLANSLLDIPSELSYIKNIQIGISRGTIWSGPVGNEEWRIFSAIGNEVNVAARLMQMSVPGAMLVTKRIAEATNEIYQWTPAGEVSIKGLSKPVMIFGLADSGNVRRADKLLPASNIVGREAERAQLKEMLHRMDADTGWVAVIEGEAGIGKSRLISDLAFHAQESGIPILVGAGYAIEQSTPYHAWRPVFETIFDLDSVDEGERRREKALEWIRTRDASACWDRAPLLAPVLSLDTQDNSLTGQMTGQVRAENTSALLISILKMFIGDAPKLLVLEDAHWFDSSSLALSVEAARTGKPHGRRHDAPHPRGNAGTVEDHPRSSPNAPHPARPHEPGGYRAVGLPAVEGKPPARAGDGTGFEQGGGTSLLQRGTGVLAARERHHPRGKWGMSRRIQS
ncbi:MAG: adenylate/guanylate cyclase domain-containing protein [Chloroflexi bacterium]|nr:adenylate/guanylate cyclase domain-containing protein [Chloroflexota bacterium]